MTPNTVVVGFYDSTLSRDFLSDPEVLPSRKQRLSRLRRQADDERGHVDKWVSSFREL